MPSIADVEEITSKTGSFKRFPIFCKMLQAALNNASDSVLAELLTLTDLQQLQAQHPRTGSSATAPLHNSGKRYFILTYAAEYDRVHYPLPLAPDEPSVQQLRNVIRDLREQLHQQPRPLPRADLATPTSLQQQRLAAVHAELARLQDDNATLRRRLADGPQSTAPTWGGPLPPPPPGVDTDMLREVQAERDALAHRLATVEQEAEAERDACRKDLRRRAREVQVRCCSWSDRANCYHKALPQTLQAEIASLRGELVASAGRVRRLAAELEATQRQLRTGYA